MPDHDAFPLRDPVGPADPAVVIPNVDVIADVVATGAEDADALGVPRSTIEALAMAGLHGAALEPASAQRELAELIAGSDASTWFCWAQHQTPLRVLSGDGDGPGRAALQSALLPGLRSGALLAAVAFAHVRRPGPANPLATRIAGGWRLEGSLDWVTSWDIADVVMVMAQGAGDDTGRLVCGYLPAGRADGALTGVRPGEPLRLLAMSGTHTRPVRLDGVVVPDSRVGAVLDRDAWLAADAQTAASASPSAFGVARGAIADLESLAVQRGDDDLLGLAMALVEECRMVRGRAYAAMDDGVVADRLTWRARSLDLVVRTTTAAVVARAGSAMRSGHPTERRVREAMFLQVQAQTGPSRSAMLALMVRRATGA
ncbi:MAG: acyl-CoA dehydrogenase family protein [Actinomycetota bacterium]|nr:acyl-CoA dehydrogenase family protein [Actinomycetota bacterium]